MLYATFWFFFTGTYRTLLASSYSCFPSPTGEIGPIGVVESPKVH